VAFVFGGYRMFLDLDENLSAETLEITREFLVQTLQDLWISNKVNSEDGLILAYCLPFGKAGRLQILRCKGIAVK
jgi:hypothetical protein